MKCSVIWDTAAKCVVIYCLCVIYDSVNSRLEIVTSNRFSSHSYEKIANEYQRFSDYHKAKIYDYRITQSDEQSWKRLSFMRHHKPPGLLYFPHFHYELRENCDGRVFNVHGSVHRESMSITVQQDATVYSLLCFCKLLYMFRVVTLPIIRSTCNCNYGIWHWSNFGKCSVWSQLKMGPYLSSLADFTHCIFWSLTSARCCNSLYVLLMISGVTIRNM
jgi:hypothetical protein